MTVRRRAGEIAAGVLGWTVFVTMLVGFVVLMSVLIAVEKLRR